MVNEVPDTGSVTIRRVAGPHALYHKYPREIGPQPAYVQLDCEDGDLSADYSAEVGGNSMPESVWHERTLRWTIPTLTDTAANRLMDELLPLARRIVAGYQTRWDGNNDVGTFTADARDAADAAASICDDYGTEEDLVLVWYAEDWFEGDGRENGIEHVVEKGLAHDSTDADIARILAEEVEEASEPDRPALILGGEEWLKDAVEELKGRELDVVLDYTEPLDLRTQWCAKVPDDLPADVERAILDALDDRYWQELVKAWKAERPGLRRIVRVEPAEQQQWMTLHPGEVDNVWEPDEDKIRQVNSTAMRAVPAQEIADRIIAQHKENTGA